MYIITLKHFFSVGYIVTPEVSDHWVSFWVKQIIGSFTNLVQLQLVC